MKKFSKAFLVVAATLVVQLSLSSIANAQTVKENKINSKIFIQEDKDNKEEKIKDSKESSTLEAPDNKSEKSEDSKKSNAIKVQDDKAQKSEDKKIKDSKESSALEAPDNKNEKSEDSKKSNAIKVPDNKAKKPEDIKGDKAQKPEKNETDKTQKPQDKKENNIPKLMKVNQISPNQIEISYDKDVDIELATKATNYWVQDTMNDKAKGIASLGKNDKVDAKNSLTDDKVRIEAKEDSQRTFVLTFSKDIPKGAEYKLIICYVTVEGAPPYTGDNGMMTFVGK